MQNVVMENHSPRQTETQTRGGTPRPKGRTGPERLIIAAIELTLLCVLVPLFIVLINWTNVSFDESPLQQGQARVTRKFLLAPIPLVTASPTRCLSIQSTGKTTVDWGGLQGWVTTEIWEELKPGDPIDVSWKKGRLGVPHAVALGKEESIDRVHLLDTRFIEMLGRIWPGR